MLGRGREELHRALALTTGRLGGERKLLVGDGLAEWPGIDARRIGGAGLRWQRQQRKHQFGEPIGFLQMRIARHDEGIDAERHVFLHARGHRRRIADQRGPGAAAHQADAGPEIGADLELVAAPAVELHHASLTDRIHARKDRLRAGDGFVADVVDKIVGGLPGLARWFRAR